MNAANNISEKQAFAKKKIFIFSYTYSAIFKSLNNLKLQRVKCAVQNFHLSEIFFSIFTSLFLRIYGMRLIQTGCKANLSNCL